MFTLFDLLQLCGTLSGITLGIYWGWSHFGIVGGILGIIVGGCVGLLCSRLPWTISWWRFKQDMQSKSSMQLRQELQGERYFIFHLYLAELMTRGEDIRAELDHILILLQSDSSDRRRFGWQCLQFAYPDLAQQISDYDPFSSVETCRTKADVIAHAA